LKNWMVSGRMSDKITMARRKLKRTISCTFDPFRIEELDEWADLLGWSRTTVMERCMDMGKREFIKEFIEPAEKKKHEEEEIAKQAEKENKDKEEIRRRREREKAWHEAREKKLREIFLGHAKDNEWIPYSGGG